jgi:peptidoglycan/xylan/chitin deacetylase (PgdA/CDA1 family)
MKAQLRAMRRNLMLSMYSRRVPLGNRGPIVSFTFDDFPRTALTAGGCILKEYGCRGTYYTAVGLMDTVNGLGDQFRQVDLETLLKDGHELASHTFDHVSSRTVSCVRFRKEVEKGRRALEELTGQEDLGNFAFPFGEVTLSAKRSIGRDVASSRSIYGGVNGDEVDLNLLRANSLYGGRDKCDQVRELILENERRSGWLIFYSHDIRPMPSRFGCTPELLEFAVSFASRRNARISTVAKVVTELTGQLAVGQGSKSFAVNILQQLSY